MKPIELLAPAKDLECGIAAIDCGADAVYIAAERFGARRAAGNAIADIEKLVKYAHVYWAKVYVTVNTIIGDESLGHVAGLIQQLYAIGVDAVIVQDMALLEMDLPPIPFFASTQTDNRTWQKVKFLEDVGFKRIILARELSLSQIKEIRQHTSVDLECFIHGALCVCYSGQCYLSYAIGGRSSNRGECAQPCRRTYTLLDSSGKEMVKDRHLLSLKDLDLSCYLGELIDAGVSSFKIEGRLKDVPYVMNNVGYYRKKLDLLLKEKGLKRASSGSVVLDFEPDPNKTFNRGYTSYFLKGRQPVIAEWGTPKSLGEKIGPVTKIGTNYFAVDADTVLHNGDGICFFKEDGTLSGTTVNTADGRNVFPLSLADIQVGTIIYRNLDREFLNALKSARTQRRIGVSLELGEDAEGLVLRAIDGDGNKAEFRQTIEKVPADNKEKSEDTIRKQLAKLGDTEFVCTNISITTSSMYFIPIKILNELRRQLIAALRTVRDGSRPKMVGGIVPNDVPYPEKELTYTSNVLNKKAEAFYRRHGVEKIEPAVESGLDMHGRQVMTTKYCILHQLGLCRKVTGDTSAEPLFLRDEDGREFTLFFDCNACEMQVWG